MGRKKPRKFYSTQCKVDEREKVEQEQNPNQNIIRISIRQNHNGEEK